MSNPAIQSTPLLRQAYTPDGLIASLTNANGFVTNFTPDGFDRLSTTTYPNASTEVLGYDADSNITSRKTRAGATIALTYDSLNRLATKTAPSEPTVTYSYDLTGRPTAFTDNSASIVGPTTTGTIGTLTSTYDSLNHLSGSVWGPTVAQSAFTAPSATFTYGYDASNRRISQTATDNSYWSYPTATAGTASYTANNLDQYAAVGSVTPTYDGNGNLTYDGTFTYGYDAESRLISASGAGNSATYAYDAQGRRKSKTVNGTTTIFVQDPQARALLDYDGSSGAIQNWYAFGSGPNDPLSQINLPGSTRATYVPDIQGSVIASLDASSGVLTKAGYRPYGESNTATGVFRYTGARIDSETNGLYNSRARMYSPVLGRFMQVDPIGTRGGVNLYAYVGNDPLNLLDPYGLSPDSPLSKAATSFYNNLLAQPVKDISDLINNPSQIANAIASVAPGLGPIAELPQALSGAIGTAKGLSSLVSAAGNGSPAPTEYNYTNTVENNAASRPYINSPLTIQEITSTGAGAPDPGGIPGALRYDVPGTVSRPGATVGAPNATITGTYELVIDPKTNTVYHFLFKSGP